MLPAPYGPMKSVYTTQHNDHHGHTTEPIIPADKSFFKAKMVGAVGNLCYAFLAVLSFTLGTAFFAFPAGTRGRGAFPVPAGGWSEIRGLAFCCFVCCAAGGVQPKGRGAQRANGTTKTQTKRKVYKMK